MERAVKVEVALEPEGVVVREHEQQVAWRGVKDETRCPVYILELL